MAGSIVWLAPLLEVISSAGTVNLEIPDCTLRINGRKTDIIVSITVSWYMPSFLRKIAWDENQRVVLGI